MSAINEHYIQIPALMNLSCATASLMALTIFVAVLGLELLKILEMVRKGEVTAKEAEAKIRLLATSSVERACLDVSREARKGVPEIVFAETKTLDDLIDVSSAMLKETGRAILTRVSERKARGVAKHFSGIESKYDKRSRVIVLRDRRRGQPEVQKGGKVAIFTAGTADAGVAEEAKAILVEMGREVLVFYDVGVAGIHRLFPAVKVCLEDGVVVAIVVAGMEGALASVISGLVPFPVIGVPASSGYGLGGKGKGALVSMLQSCSPGLVVVNIDNGVGAAVAAAMISIHRA